MKKRKYYSNNRVDPKCDMRGVYDDVPDTVTAERCAKMWRAKINQMLIDATSLNKHTSAAISWFTNITEDYMLTCDYAGIDPEYLRRMVIARVEANVAHIQAHLATKKQILDDRRARAEAAEKKRRTQKALRRRLMAMGSKASTTTTEPA